MVIVIAAVLHFDEATDFDRRCAAELAAETGMHEAATDAARAKLSMVPHGKAQGAERGIGAPRATELGGVQGSPPIKR